MNVDVVGWLSKVGGVGEVMGFCENNCNDDLGLQLERTIVTVKESSRQPVFPVQLPQERLVYNQHNLYRCVQICHAGNDKTLCK